MKSVYVHRLGLPTTPQARESISARMAFVKACMEYIPLLNFDLLHASNTFTQWIALCLRTVDQPKIARIADVYQGDWIKNTNLITGLVGEVMERAVLNGKWSGVISWSQATQAKLNHYHLPSTVIYGGIDYQYIAKTSVAKKKTPTICTVSRLVKYKHIDTLIGAVARLSRRHPQLKLEIIGDGPERENLEQLAANLKISHRVSFLGMINLYSHVLNHLKAATLFSLPSTVEGFGLATLEACACGTPYINVATPATAEITKGGIGGSLIPSPQVESLASEIDRLLSDPKGYNTKVRECKKLAISYDWEHSAHESEKFFIKVYKQKH